MRIIYILGLLLQIISISKAQSTLGENEYETKIGYTGNYEDKITWIEEEGAPSNINHNKVITINNALKCN